MSQKNTSLGQIIALQGSVADAGTQEAYIRDYVENQQLSRLVDVYGLLLRQGQPGGGYCLFG